ncbi:MAG: dihydrodipicolinate synthase family protein [Pirellulaceae bacterium]
MLLPTSDDLVRDPIGRFPAATVACFDPTCGDLPRRQLDRSRTIQFLERLAAASVPAVLIAASTGHGHLRTTDELAEWIRTAAEANLGTVVREVLLRPEDGRVANAQLMELVAASGYPVVFIRPGRDLAAGATDAEVAANMAPLVALAAEYGRAVGIYSIPDVSGLPLTPAAAVRLLDAPGGDRLVAIKVTEADYEASTAAFLREPRLAHLKIVQGWDPHLARALRDGPASDAQRRQRCGVTSGPMSLAVFQYQHILTAAEQGDWGEVEAAQSAVTAVFRAMQDDPRRFADLQRAKYIMGLGHPLTGTVVPEQVDRVFGALAELPRSADRQRLARSLDLLGSGPFHARLVELQA